MPTKGSGRIIDLAALKAACHDCSLRTLCLPLGLADADMRALESTVNSRRKLKKGELLYRVGDPFRALYAIRSGSTKTCEIAADGSVQITGFHLPGELLGIDAICDDRHPCEVVALENSEVCELSFDRLGTLAREIPELQRQLFRIMSREVQDEEAQLLMLGRMKAEERLAAFLLNFSRRYQRLGLISQELRLPMSRQDLGDYLGLALETVSRLFSRFQDEGLITVHGRFVNLVDPARLKAVTDQLARGERARG